MKSLTGERLLSPFELSQLAQQECQRAEEEHQRVEPLANFLQSQGVDPDRL